MKNAKLRYLVDVLLWTCLAGMIFVGALLGLILPSGPVGESSKYFLSLHRHQWGAIHAYFSVAFVVLMVVHIVLNAKWIVCMTSQIFKRKAAPILTVALLAPLLVLSVFWLLTPKDAALYEGYGAELPGRGRMRQLGVQEPALPVGQAPSVPKRPTEASAAGPGAETETAAGPERVAPTPEAPDENGDHRKVGPVAITGQQTLMDIERATGLSARRIADRLGLPSSVSLDEPLGRLRRRYGIEIQAVRDLVEAMLKE